VHVLEPTAINYYSTTNVVVVAAVAAQHYLITSVSVRVQKENGRLFTS